MKKKTVVDFKGRKHSIKSLQESYFDFPSTCHKGIDDYGNPYLTNIVYKTTECGCEIVGCGDLLFPLSIKYCSKHEKVTA